MSADPTYGYGRINPTLEIAIANLKELVAP